MKIGALVGLGAGAGRPEFLRKLGPALEERGFESLWVPEHVVFFDEYSSTYPYAEDGRAPLTGDFGLLDPFVALSFVAAGTTELRLGTGIAIIGQRNPVYTAKQVADLDVLSGGRVEFGVGVGWLREEYEVLNVPWERRGARVNEYLEVMKTLWTDEVSSRPGEAYNLPSCRMYPKPVQRPHPPIHGGGESDAALRRAVTHAQGWFGMERTPDEVPAVLDRIDKALGEVGRTRSDFSVTISPPRTSIESTSVARFADLGVDRLILPIVAQDPEHLLRVLDGAMATVNVG